MLIYKNIYANRIKNRSKTKQIIINYFCYFEMNIFSIFLIEYLSNIYS